MAGMGVDEAGGRGRHGSYSPASAAFSGQLVQIAQRGVPLGVHDGVHVLCPTEHPQFGDGLVGSDDQLHARAPGGDHSLAGRRVTGPAGAVEDVVGGVVDGADQAEGFGSRSAPEQRGLTSRGVVLEGGPGEVAAALDDGVAVVGDRVRSHHPHPGHTDSLSPARGTPLQSCSRYSGGVTRDRRSTAMRIGPEPATNSSVEPVEDATPSCSFHWRAEVPVDPGGLGHSVG